MIRDFRNFVYVGGGYWRDAKVPKGEKAELLHGEEARGPLLERIAALEAALAETARWLRRIAQTHNIGFECLETVDALLLDSVPS